MLIKNPGRLINRQLVEEIKLRKHSYQTGKAYISVVKRFLKSGYTHVAGKDIKKLANLL